PRVPSPGANVPLPRRTKSAARWSSNISTAVSQPLGTTGTRSATGRPLVTRHDTTPSTGSAPALPPLAQVRTRLMA
ncbi:MAG: hypothetical protein ACK56F_25210, partial [bacterium]